MTKEEKRLVEKAKKTSNALVRIFALPRCDFCGEVARVDGKTRLGSWAYMCPAHYRAFGVGLGLGKGQVLVTQEEEI